MDENIIKDIISHDDSPLSDEQIVREWAKLRGEGEKDKEAMDKFKLSFAQQLKGVSNEEILSDLVIEPDFFENDKKKEQKKIAKEGKEKNTVEKKSKIKDFFNKLGEALCK